MTDAEEPGTGAGRRRQGSSVRGLVSVIGFRGISMALVMLQSIVLARVFGAYAFGVFSFAVSVVTLVVLGVSLGLDQYMMREVAKLGLPKLAKDPEFAAVRGLIGRIVAPLTLLVSVIGAALACIPGFFGHYSMPLLAVFASLSLLMLRKYAESLALGLKRPTRSFMGSNLAYPLVMLGGAAVFWAGSGSDPETALSWIYVIAIVVSTAVAVILVRDALPTMFRRTAVSRDQVDRKAVFTASIHLTLISAGFILGRNLDVLMTGFLADPVTVAAVRILSRLGEAVAIFRVMGLTYYKPYLAEAGMRDDREGMQKHATSMASLYLVTGVPMLVILWVFAPYILAIWGSEYVEFAWAMRLYMLGVFVMLVGGPASATLSMSGRERFASRALWGSLVVSAIGNAALIPVWGVLGCAVASLASMIVLTTVSVYYARRELRVATTGFDAVMVGCRRLARRWRGRGRDSDAS